MYIIYVSEVVPKGCVKLRARSDAAARACHATFQKDFLDIS